MWYCTNAKVPLRIAGLRYNFMPSWWHHYYGLSWGRQMFFDPGYRLDAYLRMERLMWERFPSLRLGSAEPLASAIPPSWDNAAICGFAGAEVMYQDAEYAACRPLSEEQLERLPAPEPDPEGFPYREILRQVAELNQQLHREDPALFPTRGILNDAVGLRGSEFFLDMMMEPEKAAALLDWSKNLILNAMRCNARQKTSWQQLICLLNCTVMMISPAQYLEWLLEREMEIYREARRLNFGFGIHHCGNFDQYLEGYRRFPQVDFLEIGSASQIRPVLERFPEAQVQYIFDTTARTRDFRAKTRSILEEVRGYEERFFLVVPDIDVGVDDADLIAICEECRA